MPKTQATSVKQSVATTQLTGTLQAAQEPAHTGDVTNSAGSLALTIANAAVTQAKTANYTANTLWANNAGSGAAPADFTFKQVASQAYTGAITWSFTTSAPSSTTNHTYTWSRIGNTVWLRINLSYAVAGSGVTAVVMDLPSDCPSPLQPSGFTAASDIIALGNGRIFTSTATQNTAAMVCYIRRNAGDTGFEIVITNGGAAQATKVAEVIITYLTN